MYIHFIPTNSSYILRNRHGILTLVNQPVSEKWVSYAPRKIKCENIRWQFIKQIARWN